MTNQDKANLELYRFMDSVDTSVDVFKPDLDDPFVKHICFLLKLAKSKLELIKYEPTE
jgi:hypothetical protein